MPLQRDERILLIGDTRHEMRAAVGQAVPDAEVTSVASVFDGIAALAGAGGDGTCFTTILAAAEPIERRPEAAVRTLRELAGPSRLVLFGHPTLELLSQKMLKFGCDDYVVTPAGPAELRQVLLAPNHRLDDERPVDDDEVGMLDVADDDRADAALPAPVVATPVEPTPAPAPPAPAVPSQHEPAARPAVRPPASRPAASLAATEQALAESMVTPAGAFDLAAVYDVLLEGLLQQPNNPVGWTLRLASARLAPAIELIYRPAGEAAPAAGSGRDVLSAAVTTPDGPGGTLYALVNHDADDHAVLEMLARLAGPVGKVLALQGRHAALQRLAITDEMTGVFNARYFRHFLTRILEKARQMHFPVTLLLFDIDDFKTYNDQFGHGVGDEILKQTAAMMKRCTREHDLVARIGGDEFAVVFWDKEGPRQPREPRTGNPSRPPHSPVQVFERFKRMIQSDEFTALGHHGKGKLGISAGLAVYPYEGHDVETLIAEADKALMQGSKKHGKNRLSLVGNGIVGHGTNVPNGH